MVEKIKRDVRITRIYEGTSEIMEMTIARDRWQQHLKTRGAYYHDAAARARCALPEDCGGADVAALALRRAWPRVLEACRVGRLTRNQHVLLRLGELIAYAEGAGALARRARSGGRRRAAGQGRPTLRRRRAGRGQPGLRPGRGAARSPRRACAGWPGRARAPTSAAAATAGAGAGRAGRSARRHGRGRRRALRTGAPDRS